MTKEEALRLALDALECWQRNEDCNEPRSKIIGAIKAALEAKYEPVAYINVEQRKLEWAKYVSWGTPTVVNLPKIPLYTTPPQRTWVGLTDEEIVELHHEIKVQLMGTYKTEDIYRAIEVKLKEKNT
jgi:hypothetical protein